MAQVEEGLEVAARRVMVHREMEEAAGEASAEMAALQVALVSWVGGEVGSWVAQREE